MGLCLIYTFYLLHITLNSGQINQHNLFSDNQCVNGNGTDTVFVMTENVILHFYLFNLIIT